MAACRLVHGDEMKWYVFTIGNCNVLYLPHVVMQSTVATFIIHIALVQGADLDKGADLDIASGCTGHRV